MLAYWLMPSSESRDFFSSVIRDLAQRYDAAPFAPHVTLYGSNDDPASARNVLARVAAVFEKIRLEVDETGCSEELAKTVFVRFKPNEALSRLSDSVRNASTSRDNYELNPHLSLIYQHLPMATKKEIASSVSLPFADVRFDAIQAIEVPMPFRTAADVETWKMIESQSLK